MRVVATIFQVMELGLDGPIHQSLLHGRLFLDAGLDLVVDTIEQSGDRGEECWT